MTQNEVIEMAKQAGFDFFNGWRDWGENCEYAEAWPEHIEVFAKLIAAKERDRMCKQCTWGNYENTACNEANRPKVLGKG